MPIFMQKGNLFRKDNLKADDQIKRDYSPLRSHISQNKALASKLGGSSIFAIFKSHLGVIN